MDEVAYEFLIQKLDELGGPNTWPADWIPCMDMDALRDISKRQRPKWLKKAKNETMRRRIQERVDQIAEAVAENDGLGARILVAAFPSDVEGLFPTLTPTQRKMWLNQVTAVAEHLPRS